MRRLALAIAALMLVAVSLTACGKETRPTDTAASFTCPSQSTKSFAIPRFAANVGIVVFSFHHWIYEPYKKGAFQKGAHGRLLALAKAGGTALLDYNRLQHAVDDVKASKTLCPAIGKPLARVSDYFSNLKSALLHGDFGKLALIEGGLGSLTSLMGRHGASVPQSSGS